MFFETLTVRKEGGRSVCRHRGPAHEFSWGRNWSAIWSLSFSERRPMTPSMCSYSRALTPTISFSHVDATKFKEYRDEAAHGRELRQAAGFAPRAPPRYLMLPHFRRANTSRPSLAGQSTSEKCTINRRVHCNPKRLTR
jgi:hypothetical protein